MSADAGEEAIDEAALLEWVNLVGKCGQLHPTVKTLASLDVGDFLLRVLHDAAPIHFASPESILVESLLRGLQQYFRLRQGVYRACSYNGEACAHRLLQQAALASSSLDVSQIVQLAILATLINDDANAQERYVKNYQTGLTSQGKQAIQAVHLGFEQAAVSGADFLDARDDEQGFLESGQDYESRYRKLKQSFTATETERERLEEECSSLRTELEEERRLRRDAEDAESTARMELKQADMSKARAKEEQRAIYEDRSDHQAQRYKEEIKELKSNLESCREQHDYNTNENKKLQVQLKECRRKVEVHQQRVAELEAMAKIASKVGQQPDSSEHPGSRIDAFHMEASEPTDVRAEMILLTQERDALKAEMCEASDTVAQLRAKLAAVSGQVPPLRNTSSSSFQVSAESELAAVSAGDMSDMMERLKVEKDRAMRAEEQLKTKREVITILKDQKKEDAAQLASLHEQLVDLRGQLGRGSGPCDSELKAQVARQERELQVQEYRRSLEVEPLVVQQALMASAFHELGVKYHKLRLKYERLQRCNKIGMTLQTEEI